MRSLVDIERLVPGEDDIWLADLVVRIEDEVGGTRVHQVVKVTVRFSQKDDATIESVFQSVQDRVRSSLEVASAVLENSTIAELRALDRKPPLE